MRYDDSKFPQLVDDLLKSANDTADLSGIPALLAQYGIRILFVVHLLKSKLDGAAFWLDDDSPVVVLTLRLDRIDNFWHVLIHEMIHNKYREKVIQFAMARGVHQMLVEDRLHKMAVWCRNSDSGRKQSGQDTSASWRTERAGGVGLRELDAPFCETIDVWCFNELTSVKGKIIHANVVRKDKDHVWLPLCGRRLAQHHK